MRNRASLSLRVATLLTGLGVVVASARGDDASAAWPPARGANVADPANWPNDPNYKRTWQHFSWLPSQTSGTPAYLDADKKLGAAGMSVDKAWTYTIGRPDVRIAIVDSGIQWENPDLVNRAWLNPGELNGDKRPRDKDGQTCGGTGALAGYDCNGDGAFTMADYREDPRLTPVVTGEKCYVDAERTQPGGDRLKGDVNRNCILDAGDLIANPVFSDGLDDDANGYTDDISGWDFFKNDNDPYDDTRYGHGSSQARDAVAEGNNGIADVGVCPGCRFIPLRVGDSFIADANDFAKAVAYATDNGAKVVQEALGTVDQTPFSRAAIDYAYTHGVAVIASVADENSRHHNMPAVANHTLPVHAITYDGSEFNQSKSFLAFNTCTNYGGHNMLSLSGGTHGCSSEATARGGGVAGLIYSHGLNRSLNLTAEEVMQLFKMTADDVDVPESRSADREVSSRFYDSRPGFDQRFGYGRVNVARAMQAIEDGAIPPEVDLVSPEWYDVLYANRISEPVPIAGSIAARRATSYDWRVEWAPGVQPADTDFHVLAEAKNVPSANVTGGPTQPLATFDPREIDTAHVRDPDSPHGENDRTITLRVRAVAHYGGGRDVAGEARRAVAVVNAKNGLDPDLLPGFPVRLGGSIEPSPKLADIDGDGRRDVVAVSTDGSIHALRIDAAGAPPVELAGFPYRTSLVDGLDPVAVAGVPTYFSAPAYAAGKNGGIDPQTAREAIVGSPAVGDLDGDGKNEIVAVSWPGTVYVVKSTGAAAAGWPKRLPLVPSCPLDPSKPRPERCMDLTHKVARGAFGSPVLADLDRDGKLDVLVPAMDGRIHVFKADGSPLPGWPVDVHAPQAKATGRVLTTPTVADFNGDGILDVATGSNETIGGGDNAGPVFILDGRGTETPGGSAVFKHFPVAIVSQKVFPLIAEGLPSSQAAADFDGDGKPDILVQGNGAPPFIFPFDPGPQSGFSDPPNRLPLLTGDDGTTRRGLEPTANFGELTNAFRPDTMFPLLSQPSIGDLDQDGVPDVIMTGGSLSLAGNLAGGASSQPFQHLLAMWSGRTGKMFPGSPVVLEDYTFLTSQAVADVNGDGYPEVLVGTGAYFVRAVDACGREAVGWPKFTNGWHVATPAVGDVDGDHQLDVVSATRTGLLFAWKTRGRDDGVVQWESFHHDNQNTGDFGRPLAQGTLRRAAQPIDCAIPAEPTPERYDAGGCSQGGDRSSRGPLTALGVGAATLLAGILRRLRRGASDDGRT